MTGHAKGWGSQQSLHCEAAWKRPRDAVTAHPVARLSWTTTVQEHDGELSERHHQNTSALFETLTWVCCSRVSKGWFLK
eukprot:2048050-Amphidinium_carterae.1